MGKLPAFLFYPNDWFADLHLRRCSHAAKGVWIDMLCLMFGAPSRGMLAAYDSAGQLIPWTDDEVAWAVGGDKAETLECLRELLAKGVAHRSKEGAIFSRRMLRDEEQRRNGNGRVKKHRDKKSNAACNGFVTQSVTPFTETENETEFSNSVSINEQQATSYVFLEVGLAGNQGRMAIQDAIKSLVHKGKTPKEAAEFLVSEWNEYDRAQIQYKNGKLKFFENGIWNSNWRANGNGKQSSYQRNMAALERAFADDEEEAGSSATAGGNG